MQAFTNLLDEEPRMFLFEHVFTISVGMFSFFYVPHGTSLYTTASFKLFLAGSDLGT